MLDPKFIRSNPDAVRKALKDKGETADLNRYLELDDVRRNLLVKADALKHRRNEVSEEIGRCKKAGDDASKLMAEMKEVAASIKSLDEEIKSTEEAIEAIARWIPNVPHPSVPVGDAASANEEVKRWGDHGAPSFDVLPHWQIGESLGLMDLKRASKLSGSNFGLFTGVGARLERALINFMLDYHVREHGYREVSPPFIVRRECLFGTGQLPKLEEDMYLVEADDLFLIPTAEVPLTNIYGDEILDGESLPVRLVSYTPCFRREAGSYGRDTRGLVRIHQFDKVEMVKIVEPEGSYDELESLLRDACDIVEKLELPYRVMNLATGDLSFAAAKCYDIELWAKGEGKWLEASSCSNFEDFQARRIGLRFRPAGGGKPRYAHTLNGSGLALPRTVIAILENYQTSAGALAVPEVLRPYMGGLEEISLEDES
jgi:seryl-tRNA synthetase